MWRHRFALIRFVAGNSNFRKYTDDISYCEFSFVMFCKVLYVHDNLYVRAHAQNLQNIQSADLLWILSFFDSLQGI